MAVVAGAVAWFGLLLTSSDAATPAAWKSLRFEGRKAIFLEGSVDLERRLVILASVGPLEDCEEAGAAPPSAGVLVELRAVTRPGGPQYTTTWLDPQTQAVIQVEDTKPGSRWKRQRFGPAGACELRRRPLKGTAERRLPWSEWTDRRDRFVPASVAGGVPTDSFGLLCLASSVALSEAGTAQAWIVSRGKAVAVVLTAGATTSCDHPPSISYAPGEGSEPPSPRLGDIIRVGIVGTSEDDDDDSTLGIMGLGGPVEVLVDRTLGLPVEVRGRLRPLGEVRVRLVSAVLERPPAQATAQPAAALDSGAAQGDSPTQSTNLPDSTTTSRPAVDERPDR